ncbi:Predicted DNA-binding transcriptional regulator YafY, contains an HTH and WYL domains [Saccharopolyspora antimicrobica]|uniref:DNA-binding transcriptional regulator YafY n=1 Tax=Saccharopolyspora antimicrobica TaxID=455193 RepID=A0A1I5HDA2_9PSEU|nr:YafY family protein [Saccharopolyspora antimicrobica]RKT85369.1 putative DNA-binding transcriptional regulator YafY [Saccharopolyspora antimicrobica]SFO46040.1 Predicted DNA-binding transcriptional regulator YafY, contains an HTH and WYL domains [Saccharopolyspora antimicrobica]
MRASRLLTILLLLQTRGRMTAQELAGELEVSVRTVYRDVESLSEAGIPLCGEPGHQGGYRLLDGFRTRLTGLTTGEAESLFLTGLPAAAAELGLGEVVTAAHLKLMAALPADLRARSGRLADRFHLDTPAWYDDADRTPHLTAVADAVWNDRTVRMRYLRWAEPHETSRTVQPYGLVLKAGHWYLVAGSGERIRTYRVSRIVDLHVLDERFTRPAGFDLADHWKSYLERFDSRRHSGEAVVKLSPRAFDRLPHLVEPMVVRAARRTAGAPDERGWIRVTVPIESVDQALPEFLKLGADAEVLAPVELRDRITATLGELTRLYGTG